MRIKSLVAVIGLILGTCVSLQAQSIQRSPEQVAQALVDAFNKRDIEGIMATYSADSVARTLPTGDVIITGHDDIRKKFTTIFNRDPKAKVEIVNRIVDGKFVIDKEKITGESNGKSYEFYGTVIYEITDGLIRREWYLKS
jgi:hypothetical protein